jgi:hypothetical protein
MYHHGVFTPMNNLIDAIGRLDMIPIFLKCFPRTATFDKNHITVHRWVQYHYSNYVVTMTSIYDTALLMVNAILGLGLDPRDCTAKKVAEHRHIQKFGVKKALDELATVVQPYREPRHFFVHRNIMPRLGRLDDLERMRRWDELEKALNLESEPFLHPRLAKLFYKYQRRQLTREVVKESTRMADSVYALCDALHYLYVGLSRILTEMPSFILKNPSHCERG